MTTLPQPFKWARYASNNYEVSSKGDRRFSALFAKLPCGRTVEEVYQLDVKGYRVVSSNWRSGKGRPPMNGKSPDDLWDEYLDLWRTYFQVNPKLANDLFSRASGKTITDMFASSLISQARACSTILNEMLVVRQIDYFDGSD